MTSKQKARLTIMTAYRKLQYLDDVLAKPLIANLFDMAYQEEKQYRHAWHDRTFGINIRDAAQYFTVHYVLSALMGKRKVVLTDLLTCKQSSVYGGAIAEAHSALLLQIFEEVNIEEFEALDYCELVQ